MMRSVLALTMLTTIATPALAQEEPDFLFGAPRGAFSVRAGYMLASADSDISADLNGSTATRSIYTFLGDELTIEPSDFNAFVLGFDVALAIHPRLDVLLGVEYTRTAIDSAASCESIARLQLWIERVA